MEYNFREIEKKWQRRWVEQKTYRVAEDKDKEKYYVLNMFPYPSGAGLHVGHPLGYIASDIYARYKRLRGYNVLNPMGYDAYGLPAEQYAIQTGQHPAITTEANINHYREQLDKIGFSFDWDREVRTCDPKYYHWTQWAFQKMFASYYDNKQQKALPIERLTEAFEKGGTVGIDAACSEELAFTADEWRAMDERRRQEVLMNYRIAYLGETMVNWCPQLGTVLANDEVVDGVSERGGYPVVQKKMRQWCLRVSAYAQRLLDGLDTIDWTDSLKETQRNWIGRSEGAEVRFTIKGSDEGMVIFTTRADTMFGVTFMVLAPESELVEKVTTPEQKAEVDAYLERTKKRTERERISDRSVSGVFSGSYAINPMTGEEVPIWISDYVLAGYGTGAIMAVPAHDSRDYAFAKHFGLEIRPLIEGCDVSEQSFDAKEGIVCNSPKAVQGSECGVQRYDYLRVKSGETGTTEHDSQKGNDEGAKVNHTSATDTSHSALEANHTSALRTPNSALILNGLTVKEAIAKTKKYVEEQGLGRVKVNYRLRDAIFSRQRYWGEPFPVYYKDGMPYMIPESCLPLELPEVDKFLPTETGEPPLGHATRWAWDTAANCVTDNARIDNVTVFPLELNTMPGFAGSSAYYLRYMDPHNDKALVSPEADGYWREVDLYVGGTEHATGHLIYSRFWNKFLRDIGVSAVEEPFKKLVNQGMIQGRSNFVYRIKDTNTFVSLGLKEQYDTTPLHVDVNIVHGDVLDIEAFSNWRPEYKDAEFILEDGAPLRDVPRPRGAEQAVGHQRHRRLPPLPEEVLGTVLRPRGQPHRGRPRAVGRRAEGRAQADKEGDTGHRAVQLQHEHIGVHDLRQRAWANEMPQPRAAHRPRGAHGTVRPAHSRGAVGGHWRRGQRVRRALAGVERAVPGGEHRAAHRLVQRQGPLPDAVCRRRRQRHDTRGSARRRALAEVYRRQAGGEGHHRAQEDSERSGEINARRQALAAGQGPPPEPPCG